jgi:hypothetical protein
MDVLQKNGFQGRVVSKTHDNAMNLVGAMQGPIKYDVWNRDMTEIPGESVRCNTHLLNLVVTKVLENPDLNLESLRQKCRSVTKLSQVQYESRNPF